MCVCVCVCVCVDQVERPQQCHNSGDSLDSEGVCVCVCVHTLCVRSELEANEKSFAVVNAPLTHM